ncbi:MAG TPA: LuxR C-terminal-related transcriptional regulator, partial [Ktedonobacteraceae bacterium]|nr:LuxR C-terminal-related transcriptional regulator [Ktedonobacteraceae bacterium]
TQPQSALLETTPRPPFTPISLETVLGTLLNTLAGSPSRGILILEDYHVITSPQLHDTIAFFLDHLPGNIHLILLTRNDPPFSLARLRANHALYEVRAADLRFSQEETAALLQQSFTAPLTTETLQQLHAQMEGWGAGLHLVKLALLRTNTAVERDQALALFSGIRVSLQEYFVAEVLELQTDTVQDFLLQTSILKRLTGSLCDAIIEQHNSQDILTMLERASLFLEPLDATGQWYRYHALFSAAMGHEARRRMGEEQLCLLYTRASLWYEAHGFADEAIDASLSARDYARAASLIEGSLEKQTVSGKMHELHTLHRWLEEFPETILEHYPVLCLGYATTLLFQSASWTPVQSTVHSLDKLLSKAEQCFLRENNQPRLGEIYAFRSLLAWRQNETQAAAMYAKQALSLLPQEQQAWRGLSLCMIGREELEIAQLHQARATLLEAHTLCEAVENPHFKQVATILLANIFFEQGESQRASSWYRQALASARTEKPTSALVYILSGLAALSYECNELESASQQVQEAIELGRSLNQDVHIVRVALIQARVQQAQGQIATAEQQLATLLERLPASLSFREQEIQAALAHLALTRGDHMTVQRWASEYISRHNSSQNSAEGLLLARWLRVQGKLEEASRQLEDLLIIAKEAGHTRRMLEIQVEMVLLADLSKRKAEAQQLLREVLSQAFNENSLRLFLDAGEQMPALLRSLLPQLRDRPLLAYVRSILKAFPVQQRPERPGNLGISDLTSALVEPLSLQELRVLHLLVQHYSNAEIARELIVSINTVRTQVQSIYRKLGVHKRSAASEVARELHLL